MGTTDLFVQWSDGGQHIRKWSREPFEGAERFRIRVGKHKQDEVVALPELVRLINGGAKIWSITQEDTPAPASELEEMREHLRFLMLKQPTTGERKTYSDGFAQGLCYAIERLDALKIHPGATTND